MADVGAAQLGWRLKTLNMQPLTPVTSYMMSRLKFCQAFFLINSADL
jgi:hypothetical protein